MKTAIEALLETAQCEQELKINNEKANQKCLQMSNFYANFWCDNIIQKKIEKAIKNCETSIEIILIDDYTNETFGSQYHYCCWKMIPSNECFWGIYNSKANGYYNIPREEGFITKLSDLTTILQTAKYNTEISDVIIREATSKTGKYANSTAGKKITISWNSVCV